jgi:hypothetical protein
MWRDQTRPAPDTNLPYTKFTQRLRSFSAKRCLKSYPVAVLESNAGSRQRVESRGTVMIRQIPKVALLLAALAMAGQANAHGGGGGWAGPAVVGAIVGGVVGAAVSSGRDRTVYVEQQPVYVQQPVYYQPVYQVVSPPPVRVYGPPRGYYGPPPGYYGPPRGYYDRGRW